MNIEVKRVSEDGLSQATWLFWVSPGRSRVIPAILSGYRVETRATKRHKFVGSEQSTYNRLSQRDGKLAEADVPLPADVEEEVRTILAASIRVGRWSVLKDV